MLVNVCIFIGFFAKALHIELVSDLRTGAFIIALKPFATGRSIPSKSYSDNGSSFIGANNNLKGLRISVSQY